MVVSASPSALINAGSVKNLSHFCWWSSALSRYWLFIRVDFWTPSVSSFSCRFSQKPFFEPHALKIGSPECPTSNLSGPTHVPAWVKISSPQAATSSAPRSSSRFMFRYCLLLHVPEAMCRSLSTLCHAIPAGRRAALKDRVENPAGVLLAEHVYHKRIPRVVALHQRPGRRALAAVKGKLLAGNRSRAFP